MTMNATNDKELTKEQLYKIHLDGLKDRIKTLEDEITSLRASRDEAVKGREHEAWKHAACLTIAETGQKWGENVTPSLAMEKVFGLYHESKKLEQERDSSLAEIKRLEGELASRPAKELVEAATMARDWCNHKRIIAVIREKYNIPDTQNCEKFIYDKLDAALGQVSAPAPAKEGVVLFTDDNGTYDGWAYAVSENSSECWAFQYPKKWINDDSIKGPLSEYIKKYPDDRRLSDSEAAAFLKEHPLPKDAFSPAPSREAMPLETSGRTAVDYQNDLDAIAASEADIVAGRVTTLENAFAEVLPEQAPSDAKEAKGEVCACELCRCFWNLTSPTPAPAAPATSGAGEQPSTYPDGKPIPASERIHELEERVSELERGNQTARLFISSIKLQLDNALAALDASKEEK